MKMNHFEITKPVLPRTEIPRHPGYIHYSDQAINDRINWTREVTGASIKELNRTTLVSETLAGNIENYIGAVQIPVGIAGPVLINGKHADSYVPVPLATTEGTLVSSMTRGAKACALSGGIDVHIKQQQMLRAPVFICENMKNAVKLEEWISAHFEKIKSKAESTSSIACLKKIVSDVYGDTLHVRFIYTTGDAAGQNMTTAATWFACEWILAQVKKKTHIGLYRYYIDGNKSGDKKANYQSFMNGRGVSVTASCLIPSSILETILHVQPETYLEGWQAAEIGALQTGLIGTNINFSNTIAGIFVATGQDIACVHESSCGIFKVVPRKNGLLFTASLPCLVIGTVGGGTGLSTQKECLEIMQCTGPGKVNRLAEIIAAACLSLDISTGAAIASNDFVAAHEKLGRNRPNNLVSFADINPQFFNSLIFNSQIKILGSTKMQLSDNSGIITSLPQKEGSVTGIHKYRLSIANGKKLEKRNTILKIKTSDNNVIKNGFRIAKLSGDDNLPGHFAAQSRIFGFHNSSVREIEFYTRMKPAIKRFCPEILGVKIDYSRNLYAILMEDLTGAHNLNTANTVSAWTNRDIKTVLSDMAAIHSVYFNDFSGIPKEMNVSFPDEAAVRRSIPLLKSLMSFNAQRYPHLINETTYQIHTRFIDNIDQKVTKMKQFPMTLIHNDFNTRNLCLRNDHNGKRLALFDWELAAYHNPQVDLMEFLIHVLPENYDTKTFGSMVDHYFTELQTRVDIKLSKDHFFDVLHINALYLSSVRYFLYLLAHNILKFKFLNRVYSNLVQFILS